MKFKINEDLLATLKQKHSDHQDLESVLSDFERLPKKSRGILEDLWQDWIKTTDHEEYELSDWLLNTIEIINKYNPRRSTIDFLDFYKDRIGLNTTDRILDSISYNNFPHFARLCRANHGAFNLIDHDMQGISLRDVCKEPHLDVIKELSPLGVDGAITLPLYSENHIGPVLDLYLFVEQLCKKHGFLSKERSAIENGNTTVYIHKMIMELISVEVSDQLIFDLPKYLHPDLVKNPGTENNLEAHSVGHISATIKNLVRNVHGALEADENRGELYKTARCIYKPKLIDDLDHSLSARWAGSHPATRLFLSFAQAFHDTVHDTKDPELKQYIQHNFDLQGYSPNEIWQKLFDALADPTSKTVPELDGKIDVLCKMSVVEPARHSLYDSILCMRSAIKLAHTMNKEQLETTYSRMSSFGETSGRFTINFCASDSLYAHLKDLSGEDFENLSGLMDNLEDPEIITQLRPNLILQAGEIARRYGDIHEFAKELEQAAKYGSMTEFLECIIDTYKSETHGGGHYRHTATRLIHEA